MSRLSPTTHLALSSALALTLFAPLSASAAECVRFDGIKHCAEGSAQLNLTPNGNYLVARGLGPSGNDGVASRFQGATHWEADMSVVGGELGDQVSFRAISNGFLVSEAVLRFDKESGAMISNGLFTGNPRGTYTLAVLDDGVVVGQFENMDVDSYASVLPGPDDGPWGPPWGGPNGPIIDWPPEGDWPPDTTFDNGPFGSCIWGFRFSGDVVVQTAGGSAMGDEIRLIEAVDGAAHYNYLSFDNITTLANGTALVISSEAVSTQ